jgi:hypothetical protein
MPDRGMDIGDRIVSIAMMEVRETYWRRYPGTLQDGGLAVVQAKRGTTRCGGCRPGH